MTLIVPSITSHSESGSTWRDKLEEFRTLSITKVGLFVTGMEEDDRAECYSKLLQIQEEKKFEIPFVHAVSTMTEEEFWFLHETFGTRKFNLHPVRQYPLEHTLSREIREKIYIENCFADEEIVEEDLKGFAGVCLDLSHYESLLRGYPEKAAVVLDLAQRFSIGANHLSAVQNLAGLTKRGGKDYSRHFLSHEATLDYAAALSPALFGEICAVELEDSLADQIVAIAKLSAILKGDRDAATPLFERKAA